MRNDLLLLSSSAVFGKPYLEHALDALQAFLGTERVLSFVPYAQANHDGYTARIQEALAPLGITVRGVHATGHPRQAIEQTGVLYMGGGNSFRLLKALQYHDLLDPIRRRVAAGELRYMGSSAGTNMACPSIRTTNDMPIVRPGSFEALGLIPLQVNPHYLDTAPDVAHMGETREQRIGEFLEENNVPVLGMREGSWLRRREQSLVLEGVAGARLFQRNAEPQELVPGTNLSWLLETVPQFDRRI
ncbi:MAG TPA: dipeptidase PepE [Ktedonobacteraceae bacterium]|jgi:dipeptidase E